MSDLTGGEKSALRADLRQCRRQIHRQDGGAASRKLSELAPTLPVQGWRGTVVAAYLACGSEIDPACLLNTLEQLGAVVVLPVAIAVGAPLIFRTAGHPDTYVPDAADILAPGPSALTHRPDLILTPLLGFDDFGGRLGQGGGYYDRTLAALRASGPVLAIGLAYAAQRVARLELEPHDQRLDGVLTEEGYRAALT